MHGFHNRLKIRIYIDLVKELKQCVYVCVDG